MEEQGLLQLCVLGRLLGRDCRGQLFPQRASLPTDCGRLLS
jgi:hypothetical protein